MFLLQKYAGICKRKLLAFNFFIDSKDDCECLLFKFLHLFVLRCFPFRICLFYSIFSYIYMMDMVLYLDLLMYVFCDCTLTYIYIYMYVILCIAHHMVFQC